MLILALSVPLSLSSNNSAGEVVPIPTLPDLIVIDVEPLVPKFILLLGCPYSMNPIEVLSASPNLNEEAVVEIILIPDSVAPLSITKWYWW